MERHVLLEKQGSAREAKDNETFPAAFLNSEIPAGNAASNASRSRNCWWRKERCRETGFEVSSQVIEIGLRGALIDTVILTMCHPALAAKSRRGDTR